MHLGSNGLRDTGEMGQHKFQGGHNGRPKSARKQRRNRTHIRAVERWNKKFVEHTT
jgi:hypothetical protein